MNPNSTIESEIQELNYTTDKLIGQLAKFMQQQVIFNAEIISRLEELAELVNTWKITGAYNKSKDIH